MPYFINTAISTSPRMYARHRMRGHLKALFYLSVFRAYMPPFFPAGAGMKYSGHRGRLQMAKLRALVGISAISAAYIAKRCSAWPGEMRKIPPVTARPGSVIWAWRYHSCASPDMPMADGHRRRCVDALASSAISSAAMSKSSKCASLFYHHVVQAGCRRSAAILLIF